MPLISTSIYKRILISFLLIILFTVILSSLIEYISTRSELPKLLTEIRTNQIAQSLSAVYTRDRGWILLREEIRRLNGLEAVNPDKMQFMRIIVRDNHDNTLYNSFTDLMVIDESPLIEGKTEGILDYSTFETIGTVTVYISKSFLERETGEYLLGIFRNRLIQGGITIIIALFLAALLSKRITSPIRVLSRAAERISRSGDSQIISVRSSDELGRLTQSFNHMISSLQKQRELRKQLINDVSHDINTPLNVIRLEAKGLLDNLISPSAASRHIMKEVDKLSHMIHDLDWLAETDSGEFQLKKEKHSIGKIIQSEVERWRLQTQIKEISLTYETSHPETPVVDIDVLRINQVLGNLLENSFKYTPKGGGITVSCTEGMNEIIIAVEDTGPGIGESDLPFIFERFYRTEDSRENSGESPGLGLSIVKQIVELHGGRVGVESHPGIGSRFYFTLPV